MAATPQAANSLFAERIASIKASIAGECAQANRNPSEVTLVAVSKTQPASQIRMAYELGLRDFGESYVNELRQKSVDLADLSGLRWHFIGSLQRNKARHVVGQVELIHSVASTPLIECLQRHAASRSIRQNILIQINLAGESSKSGIALDELKQMLDVSTQAKNLDCIGLMTIPPACENPESSGRFFEQLRNLRDEHFEPQRCSAQHLSMGMSQDYRVAIRHGATLVRVGTAIFGSRSATD